jgi:hypothetical protein
MDRSDRDYGIKYRPLPSQKKFRDLDARFKGYSGPIGSGKSQALCQEAVRRSFMNPGGLGLLGAPTYPMLREATQATFVEILEANNLAYDHNKSENAIVIRDARARVIFRPTEEFERLRGTNLAWFGVDELTYTHEEAWLRLQGRLRDPAAKNKCGFAVWTPNGFDWVYRRFIKNPVKYHAAVCAEPFENLHILNQEPEFYEQLKESYDERFFRQEVLGEYINLDGGRVYTAFTGRDHVEQLRPDPRLPLCWALDFNVDPMSSVIAQIGREMVFVLDEIVLRRGTTQEACREFLDRYPRHEAGVLVYGDASGHAQQTTGASDYALIREYFLAYSDVRAEYRTPRSNPLIRERVNLVNRKLRSAAGNIGLKVDPKCKELIRDFEEVLFKDNGTQIDKDRDRSRTHLSDALGYLLWQECGSSGAAGERSKRLM